MNKCCLGKYLYLLMFFLFFVMLVSIVSAADDNSPPSISIDVDVVNGMNVNETGNVSVYASDNTASTIIINISVNNESFFNTTVGNPGVTSFYTFDLASNWHNWISVRAEDEDSNILWKNITYMVYVVNCTIVNESDGSGFDYSNAMTTGNMSHFFLYIPDLEQTYDLLTTNLLSFTYVTDDDEELLRFSMKYRYTDGTIIRSFTLSMLDEVVKLGFPEMETTFYENLIYSASAKEVIVFNINSDCYIYADYTRYAGQNQYTASVICIDMLYYLYTIDDGSTIVLSSLEGSKSALINLDFLDYENFDIDFNLLENQLAIVPYTNHSVAIYYMNLQLDNSILQIDIYDDDTLIFTYVETDNPNEFLAYFDWNTIELSHDLIEVRVTVTKDDDTETTFSQFFSVTSVEVRADSDIESMPLMILGACTVIFLLTFVSSNQVFGAVGIIAQCIGIAFTSYAGSEWYVSFLQAIYVILLIFTILIARNEGRSRVV